MKFRRFCFLLLLLFCLTGCSSNLANQVTNSTPEAAPNVYQQYNGDWGAQYFFDGEGESQIICGDKPCRESNRTNGASFKLTCQD